MDRFFSAFLEAHLHFISILLDQIRKGTSDRIDSAKVRREDLCFVGGWLVAHEADYGDMKEFQVLKSAHARFHGDVADIIEQSLEENYLDTYRHLAALYAGEGASGHLTQACLDFLEAVTRHQRRLEPLKRFEFSDQDVCSS